MIVKSGFILAAGKGSRMGHLSQHLPKPLLPISGGPLISHAIDQLEKLSIENIFVNCSYKASLIKEFLKLHHPKVVVLEEQPVLGSGGAFTNLVHKVRAEELGEYIFSTNSDVIIDIDKNDLDEFKNMTQMHEVALGGVGVSKAEKLNVFQTSGTQLTGINKVDEPGHGDGMTYSGHALIKRESVSPGTKFSSFFSEIADFQKKKVGVVELRKKFLDLGTEDKYLAYLLEQEALEGWEQSKEGFSYRVLDYQVIFNRVSKSLRIDRLDTINGA